MKNPDVAMAFVFKTAKDPEYGHLSFVRMQNGTIQVGSVLKNSRTKQDVKIVKIFRNLANEYIPIKEAQIGDIVVLGDLELSSGDYLFQQSNESLGFMMKGFDRIEPLFHQSLRFETPKDKQMFLKLAEELVRDDPSLQYEINQDTGEIILKGLGELHLEIVLQRLQKNHKLTIHPGKIQIAFKEILTSSSSFRLEVNKKIGPK